jgi:CBS domain-containing protein
MLETMPAETPAAQSAEPQPRLAPAGDGVPGDRSLDRPLEGLGRRQAVRCSPATPLREALESRRRDRVGSIVVVDGDDRPQGIFTLGDVLTRVALPQTPLDTPIRAVMSTRLHCLPAQAPAFEAALLMARENIRHVPLLRDGRLAGVVSESRLFALWRRGIGAARAALVEARDIDALARAAHTVHALPQQLLAEGLSAAALTALLTALNDLLVVRALELTGCADALAQAGGCWLAFGSQGRAEQTLATDQDNAILFDDLGDPQERRRTLLPLALEVNRALDRCGFELCRGNIMASNDQLCLSLSEWKTRFAAWIDRPDGAALLNATIFFDLRAIGGAQPLAAGLRRWLADYARDNNRFLTLMVLNAQGNEPPLGVLRDFVLQRGGAHPHTLDLKTNGVQPFVEAARVYALSCGVEATSTAERLAAAGQARAIPEAETAAWRDAFHLIQRLRFQLNAEQQAAGGATHNFLDPDTLNPLDRSLLKEALRQARNLQSRLARDFSLGGTSVRA